MSVPFYALDKPKEKGVVWGNESWVRDLKNQCIITKTPFFLKQMHCEADGKKIKMPLFDGYVWNQRPWGDSVKKEQLKINEMKLICIDSKRLML